MFTCDYCGTQFLEHTSNCPNCGAVVQIRGRQKQAPLNGMDALRSVCDAYQEMSSFYFDDIITPDRLKNAQKNLRLPANEKVIMLYDDTILNLNNKVGFAVCESGLYWANDWSVDTKRNYLAWDEFAKRTIEADGLHISLGKGDRIGMAGCGSDEVRARTLEMLKKMQKALG